MTSSGYPDWYWSALCHLGYVRDGLTPEDVIAVQRFLDSVPQLLTTQERLARGLVMEDELPAQMREPEYAERFRHSFVESGVRVGYAPNVAEALLKPPKPDSSPTAASHK